MGTYQPRNWEEALDIDDAPLRPPDQPFVLRRCSKNQSESLCLIPGPAGAVQSAMKQRKCYSGSTVESEEKGYDVISTQECIRRAVQDGSDDDFSCHSWLSAIHFVRSQGLTGADGEIGVPLSSIKGVDRVAQVVGMIKSCSANGLGDMMAILKDPTGTINASIHNSVFGKEGFCKKTVLGTVLILRQVAVFSPVPSARYLNITLNNVVEIFSEDGSTKNTDNAKLGVASHSVSNQESSGGVHPMIMAPSSSTQGRSDAIILSLRNKTVTRQGTQAKETNLHSGTASNNVDGEARRSSQITSTLNNNLLEEENEEINDDKVPKLAVVVDDIGLCKQYTAGNTPIGSSSPMAVSVNVEAELVGATNNVSTETSSVFSTPLASSSTSRVSAPKWTDEQLEMLFAFD